MHPSYVLDGSAYVQFQMSRVVSTLLFASMFVFVYVLCMSYLCICEKTRRNSIAFVFVNGFFVCVKFVYL